MLNSTRHLTAISTIGLAMTIGCSNEKSPQPPEPVPLVHPGGKVPAAPLPELAEVSPPEQLPGTISKILEEREMFERVRRLATVLPTLGPEVLPEIEHELQQFGPTTGGLELLLLARFWALHEPEAASMWVQNGVPYGYRSQLTIPVMEEWARVDPLALLTLIQASGKTGGADNSTAMQVALVRGWFYSSHPGLEDYIRGLGIGKERQRALRALLRVALDQYGYERALAWAESLDADDHRFKLAAFRQLAFELGRSHLAEAKVFCRSYCDDPKLGNGLRKHIAQQWARRDGTSAMEWVKHSPKSAETDLAAKWAWRGWYSVDTDGLFEWLDSFGPDAVEPWVQPMLELTAVDAGKRDPRRGLAWAGAISNPQDRKRALVTVATNWRRRHPQEADAWLENSPFPEQARERVRFYGRPRQEVKNDPAPAPRPIHRPQMQPADPDLAEYDE